MSVLVKGWSIPTDGCCECYFRTGRYCGILSENERVSEYAERYTRPDNCPLTELIRCKDCKHYYVLNEFRGNCSEYNFVEKIPIDYCSWAERKETS